MKGVLVTNCKETTGCPLSLTQRAQERAADDHRDQRRRRRAVVGVAKGTLVKCCEELGVSFAFLSCRFCGMI